MMEDMNNIISLVDEWSEERLNKLYPRCKYIPDLSPSPELSYLLGVRYGDMSLYKSNVHRVNEIKLKVKDKDFTEEYTRCLGQVMNSEFRVIDDEEPPHFIVRVGSKPLYAFFTELDLYDHSEWIEPYPAEFIRGFMDSEGSPVIHQVSYPEINVTLTDKGVLWYIQSLLELYFDIHSSVTSPPSGEYNIGKILGRINGRPIIQRKRTHTLHISGLDNIEKFYWNIDFSILRKSERLDYGLYQVPHPRWKKRVSGGS